jgi:hypothetical protein
MIGEVVNSHRGEAKMVSELDLKLAVLKLETKMHKELAELWKDSNEDVRYYGEFFKDIYETLGDLQFRIRELEHQ